ncbi:MAG: hypothetical protein KAJ51_16295, partial [Thermoplasmata archaeon]|nr:hypothetical protein [Thermoplasmata archaeon]
MLENEFIPDNENKLLTNTPVAFTENSGQLENEDVRFYAQGGSVWFTDAGVWFEVREYVETRDQGSEAWGRGDDLLLSPMDRFAPSEPRQYKRVVLKQEFVGANLVRPEGRERLGWNSNFFYGNDSSKWCTEVPNFHEVYYENLYNGIDLRYYTSEKGLKYDFIVHPGADVGQIRVRYKGSDGLIIDDQGDLIIKTAIENLIDGNLFIYQDYYGSRKLVKGRFKILNNLEYGFEILMGYNKDEILVIDPMVRLEYSTFIGGGIRDRGFDIEIDSLKNVFITGVTYSFDFPTTPGVYNETFSGEWDIFMFKLDQNGSTLLYSTFIGGSKKEESLGIAIDTKGNAY